MATRKKTCIVDNCTRPIKHPTAELCNACYVGLLYWSKKTPTQMIERQRQLVVLEARMAVSLGNVRVAKRKRKAA